MVRLHTVALSQPRHLSRNVLGQSRLLRANDSWQHEQFEQQV
jgi:hypothetical protein